MRILVIAQRHRFVNPTRHLLLSSLGPEFVVVGPGYGPVLRTVAEYIRNRGPFDGLVVDGALYLSNLNPARTYRWPDADGGTFADLFDHYERILVLNLLDDFHGSTPEQFTALFDPRVFVLSTAIGRDIFNYDRFVAARRERWYPPQADGIPQHIPTNYLLFPAALGDSEFASTQHTRRDEVAVLGVQYFIRQRAAVLLKAQGVRVVTGDDWRFRVLRAVNGRTGWLSGAYRRVFLDALDRAKIGVTCSGTVGYPIRKFFEIPARGAVLVAEFFEHPEALGFRSGENCVALLEEDASDAPAIINHLLSDDHERERIAAAGVEMIWSRHRITRRAEQLRDLMECVVAGDLVTARWDDGRLRLVRRSDHASHVATT